MPPMERTLQRITLAGNGACVGIAVVCFVLALATPARAASSTPTPMVSFLPGIYHGQARCDPQNPNGATTPIANGAYCQVSVESCTNPNYAEGHHVNDTLWVGTAADQYEQDWVELGYIKSWHGANVFTYYWADSRPNNTYNEHRITSPVPADDGTLHGLTVEYSGGSTWTVYIDGSLPTCSAGDVSTSNPGVSRWFYVGVESSSTTCSLGASGDLCPNESLGYKNNLGNWIWNWPSKSTYLYADGDCHAAWKTTDTHVNVYEQ